jgi:hypothetical protein
LLHLCGDGREVAFVVTGQRIGAVSRQDVGIGSACAVEQVVEGGEAFVEGLRVVEDKVARVEPGFHCRRFDREGVEEGAQLPLFGGAEFVLRYALPAEVSGFPGVAQGF